MDKDRQLITIKKEYIKYFDVNLPIELNYVVLNKDVNTGEIFLNINLVSYFESSIKALKLDVYCYNSFGEPISDNNVFKAIIQDLDIHPKNNVNINSIQLRNFLEARSVRIIVTEILMTNGVWKNNKSLIVSETNKWEGHDLENSKSLYSDKNEYKPEKTTYGWNCICGWPNSEDTKHCIKCDFLKEDALSRTSEKLQILTNEKYKSNLIEQEERVRAENTLAKKKIKSRIVVVSVIIILILGYVLSLSFFIPNYSYNAAKKSMEEEQYEDAISKLNTIIEFKNSQELIIESKYQWALNMMEEKQFKDAIYKLGEIKNHKNYEEKLIECNYYLGNDYLLEGNYKNALENFKKSLSFKDSEQLLMKATYYLAVEEFSNKRYDNAIKYFESLKNYEDANILLVKSKYQSALVSYDKGNYDRSLSMFTEVMDYEDSTFYINRSKRMLDLQGTWEGEFGLNQLVISGNQAYKVSFPNSPRTLVFGPHKIITEYDSITISLKILMLSDGILSWDGTQYTKKNSLTTTPEVKPSPKIGMTRDEVRASNWGSPNSINTTETSYGIQEQWVYDGYKYIYLEEGIVTSIQR